MSSDGRAVLVVDDNRTAADALARVLTRQGYRAQACFGGQEAIERLDQGGVDVVLTDLRMEPTDGLAVLQHARSLSVPPEVVLLTGYGTVETAVEAMRLGARDFLTKPVHSDQVLALLAQLQGQGPALPVHGGESGPAQLLRSQLQAVAQAPSPVLLVGEPGSGRDQIAREVHRLSDRRGALHVAAHPGRFDPGGEPPSTLYLPNVDLLRERDQVQLLQVLNGLSADDGTHIIASAGRGWEQVAKATATATELYFRLAVLVVSVPPLRERPSDIEELLMARLRATAAATGVTPPAPSKAQLQGMQRHAWPGNLRELIAVADRAVVFGPSAFDFQVQSAAPTHSRLPDLVEGFSLQRYLEDAERTVLVRAIKQTNMDRGKMSRILGVERNTLRYKLNKYGLLDKG